MNEPWGLRVLRSGTVVYVDPDTRRAEVQRCAWLVEVATNCPEPDFPSDAYRIEECWLPIKSIDGSTDHTTCAAGHDRHAYGTPECEAANLAAEMSQR